MNFPVCGVFWNTCWESQPSNSPFLCMWPCLGLTFTAVHFCLWVLIHLVTFKITFKLLSKQAIDGMVGFCWRRSLVSFTAAQPWNNQTETTVFKTLLGPLALAFWWLNLTYQFNPFIVICVLPHSCDLSAKVLGSISGGATWLLLTLPSSSQHSV